MASFGSCDENSVVLAGSRVNKRLSFEDTSLTNDNIKVYLRIRPQGQEEMTTINYEINGSSIKIISKERDKDCAKEFSFTHVFSNNSNQNDVFDMCAKNLVNDFVNGNNPTIMTYGTSGAGKTHSILGTIQSPGIVPRVLHDLFNKLHVDTETRLFKPTEDLEVVALSSKEIEYEKRCKSNILKLSKQQKKRKSLFSYSSMQNLLDQNCTESPMEMSTATHTVWASFAEVHNEFIYDLLDTKPMKIGQVRPKLKLCENKYGTAFIKDLTKVNIRSGDEAYKILKHGQRSAQYAATKINMASSRSHCIFTLYLVTSEDDMATLSHFNFCDLAGSERVANTQHTGKLLKETKSINSSLHVLGRCLKIVKDNQIHSKKQTIVPYRESKLTRLFHKALLGHEPLSLLINVHPNILFFEETMNSLHFASIAKDIVLDTEHCNRKSKVRLTTCFEGLTRKGLSSTVSENITEISSGEESEVFSDNESDSSRTGELIDMLYERDVKITQLEMENERLRTLLDENELEIRNELVKKFDDIRKTMIEKHEARIKTLQERHEKQLIERECRVRREYEAESEQETNDSHDFSNISISS